MMTHRHTEAAADATDRAGVRRFLVTAPETALQRFHLAVAARLNGLERRAQTVFYTCMAEDADFALALAIVADVTVQEIVMAIDVARGTDETYPIRHLGTHGLQWEPRRR